MLFSCDKVDKGRKIKAKNMEPTSLEVLCDRLQLGENKSIDEWFCVLEYFIKDYAKTCEWINLSNSVLGEVGQRV